ncbi:hypothetical protein IGI67_005139 [Enterococcus sp. AZ196]
MAKSYHSVGFTSRYIYINSRCNLISSKKKGTKTCLASIKREVDFNFLKVAALIT